MKSIFYLYWQICLLRRAPQDIPTSRALTGVTGLTYVLLNTVLGSIGQSLALGVMQAILDVVLLIVFVQLVLLVKKTPERFIQTFTALVGSGGIITALAIPLVSLMVQGLGGDMPSLLWMVLFVWSLLISGHILRHALSISLTMGVLMAGGYTFALVVLVSILFPAITTTG